MGECGNSNTPSMHHPRRRNVTSMSGLKTVTYAKIPPKMVNPRDIVGNAEEEEEAFAHGYPGQMLWCNWSYNKLLQHSHCATVFLFYFYFFFLCVCVCVCEVVWTFTIQLWGFDPYEYYVAVLLGQNFNVGQYTQAFQHFFFVPAMLIGTSEFYRFIPLPLTMTLSGGRKVNAMQNLLV